MSSLFSALGSATSALDVLERAIGVVQNNVANASTPGYVTQSLNRTASAFDPAHGLFGGVQAGSVQSARSIFAEQSVRNANQQAGYASTQAASLNTLQSQFDVSGTSGIPGALSSLYAAFSGFSANPTDQASRQQVITAAQGVSRALNQTSAGIQQIRSQTDGQLTSTVSQINQYASQIAEINRQIRQGNSADEGLQTQLYNNLEQLSNLAPISVNLETDGTATVLLGGQAPLVIGQTQNRLQVTFTPAANPVNASAVPDAQIVNADGQDVTSLVTQGQLGGLLDFRNKTIPGILGDNAQVGSLNELAQGVADRVNSILTNGQISSGPPAVAGVPLFTYNAASPTSIAASLAVDPNVSASQLAAIDAGPPLVANGTASRLAQLAAPQNPADKINGLTFSDFYSGIAATVGQQQSGAAAAQDTQTQLLTQAQNARAQLTGVSLNDQATQLLEFQQGYQAAAQVIAVINNITQTLFTTFQGIR
jgi:flagellar hook-associated protein 1 FlgK